MEFKKNSLTVATPFYYGWVIVFLAALGYFFSGPGQTYSISIFIDQYIGQFGWERSLVSLMYSLATICAGFVLFLIGRCIDKYKHRRMSIIIAILLGIACIWSSFVINPVMLFIGFFMLRLFGQGSMSLLSSTLVPQWFIKRRAFALSLMSLGMVTSAAVVPIINNFTIELWGWRVTWRVWAILLWVIYLPVAYIFLRNKPEDIGLLPDNLKTDVSTEENRSQEDTMEISWTLNEAVKTRSFWLMLFNIAVPSMISTGIVFHFYSIIGENGLDRTVATLVLSTMAMVSFPVTFLAGYIVDKIKVQYVMVAMFIIELVGIIILINSRHIAIVLLFGITSGLVKGLNGVCVNYVWANYYGRKHLGSIKGASMTIGVIGSAFGPLPFGFAFDYFKGYKEILIVMMVFALLGIISALSAPKPIKKYK
ncbi:cyanate permease [Natranaerovirga pectinivora]|uniref:Cyanate permease n=1 Tax=Natranaerovirga pectinivora TaxID=682400 RepID=A0A4R3MID4_9FIRM|nr:MFS transporter [Natranaerovirga pectinivora]TCT12139.1 cyanate permease [Natranaerovirga pectinivora]